MRHRWSVAAGGIGHVGLRASTLSDTLQYGGVRLGSMRVTSAVSLGTRKGSGARICQLLAAAQCAVFGQKLDVAPMGGGGGAAQGLCFCRVRCQGGAGYARHWEWVLALFSVVFFGK